MQMHFDVVIRGGLVVTAGAVRRWDVGVADGRIAALGPSLGRGDREIDAVGKYVLPGLLDVHTHPVYLDDMGNLSVSAAWGGITTLIHYAYAKPGQKLVETVEDFRAEGNEKSMLDFGLHAGLFDPQSQAEEIPSVVKLGVTSFKMFMTYAKLKWMTDDYQLMRTLDIIASVGGLGMVHAENGLATDYLEDKYQRLGRDPAEVFEATRPGILEAEAVNRAIALAQVAGCPLYIPHVSAKEAVGVIAQAKNRGWRVYGETCPQYLSLTGEEVHRQGPLAKIGPPLRGEDDQEALWEGLAGGVLDVVASDHAPKAKGREDDFFAAAYGSPQVETMLGVVYDRGVSEGRLTLPRLVQVMSENPAKIFGLYPRKGALAVGSDADLVVWDPAGEQLITQATQHSRAQYTLYEGWRCLGRPVLSMQRGEVLLEGGELHARPGRAHFLATRAGAVEPSELTGKGATCQRRQSGRSS
ncbi:MAG: dihydropyrimidinase [Candidatus Bipolaricaulaceae bacterium]